MARPYKLAGGRPALDPADRLAVELKTRVTEAEAARIKAAAEAQGETVAAWLRRVALRRAR